MRRALNDNPMAQIAVLGALAVIVALLLLMRMSSSGGAGEESATSTPPPAVDSAASTPAGIATDTPSATSPGEAPSTTSPSDGAVGSDPGAVGEFVAGPGLPAPVVRAYEDGKTVVLFVQRRRGIDDERLRRSVQRLGGKADLELFVTNAGHIARYSRITHGVDVDRVPALIVLRPRHLTKGPTPTATLSYGFRGPESVDQAVRDALYKGPSNLPYYPR